MGCLIVGCILTVIFMICIIIYTIVTGQFHALPKELIITIIPSLLLLLFFTLGKNNKDKTSKKNIQDEKTSPMSEKKSMTNSSLPMSNEIKNTTKKLYNCLPENYLFNIPLAYSYDYVKVCIIKGQEPDITKLQIGMEVELKQEPNNQYDNKAVAILVNDEKIGYMYKGQLKDMANDFISHMKSYVFGYITEIKNNEIYLNLGYYKKLYPKYAHSTTFKLTGTGALEIQENLSYCSEDDEVEFNFDYDKDCYAAETPDLIGYAPKNKNEIIKNADKYYSFISSIDEKEDKYTVSVTMKYE